MQIVAIIPARFGSTRFPGKPLAPILGKPLIQWTYEQALQVKELDGVWVATDDGRIFDCVAVFRRPGPHDPGRPPLGQRPPGRSRGAP